MIQKFSSVRPQCKIEIVSFFSYFFIKLENHFMLLQHLTFFNWKAWNWFFWMILTMNTCKVQEHNNTLEVFFSNQWRENLVGKKWFTLLTTKQHQYSSWTLGLVYPDNKTLSKFVKSLDMQTRILCFFCGLWLVVEFSRSLLEDPKNFFLWDLLVLALCPIFGLFLFSEISMDAIPSLFSSPVLCFRNFLLFFTRKILCLTISLLSTYFISFKFSSPGIESRQFFWLL